MVRARSEKDTSYTDRCFRCPAGTFQIFSTIFSGYNPGTLQPSDADFDDPGRMCAKCPVGTSCPRATAQQQDFGFTVGIHIIPERGFWLNSMLLHSHAGSIMSLNDSSVSSRRAGGNENSDPECHSDFCSRAAAMVSAHRCASGACDHAGNRPEEWSDLLKPENPDWMCGTSGRTGLACGLCNDGAALSAGQVCESCGDAEDLWVFQLFAVLVAFLGGGVVWYLVVWREIFREEHEYFGDGRIGRVDMKIETSTGGTGAPGAGGETLNAETGSEGDEEAEKPHMSVMDVMKAPEQLKEKEEEALETIDNIKSFPAQVAESLDGVKEQLLGVWAILVWLVVATIGSEGSDPEHIRRALMGFFKIILSYFQVTASFLKNFAVDWGERLEDFLSKLSILNLDFYKLPKLNCIVMMQTPTRTWQVAFYIALVPLCLFVLFLPRLLCFVAESWMLTVWERSRRRSKTEEKLLDEYQNSLAGLNERDSRKLQKAKDYVRQISERRTIISFHRASWANLCSVVGWAILLVGGFVVCFNLAVKASNNAVKNLDSLATITVGEKCKEQLEKLDAHIASQCDLSGQDDKASCLFCGYSEFRKSTNDCLLCPCGSELDVINRDCTGVCRKIDRGGNSSVQLPLYKALAEGKCFPKHGSECVIAEIMGRYDFVPSNGNARWELKYDIECNSAGRSGTRMGSSRTGNVAGNRRFKNLFGDVNERDSDSASSGQEGCPHFKARQEYKYFSSLKTWTDAEQTCVEWGGHLASFHSFADMNATASLMGGAFSMQAWIGLSRDAQNTWTWSDGAQRTYAASNWWGFSSSWTTVAQTWCDGASKSARVPPQPRPTPGHNCVYITLHGNASTCRDEQNPVSERQASALKYSGWTNGACSAAKHFVCSKPLISCANASEPTSWPPLHPLQMRGDGIYYWKAMCEIESGNGFGALSGEGELPYSICYSPWTEYAEAFGHTARRVSASKASDTVSITPQQASLFIVFAYVGASVSLICALAFIIYTKFGMNGIAVLEGISTNILGPLAFGLCVHGALSDTPEPVERLRDRAEWTPGLLVLPAAFFLHLSLGFFIQPSKKYPCPWIHGAGYLGVEVFCMSIVGLGTASAFGLVLTDAAGLRLLIGLGTLAGLSILLILYGISSALGRGQRAKALTILALFVCACGLGVGTYFSQEEHEIVTYSLFILSLSLALLCYVLIIHTWKVATELEERLSFHKDLESGSLSGFRVEAQAGHSKPMTRDNLHKDLTEILQGKKTNSKSDKPLEEDLDAALETAKAKAKNAHVSGVSNATKEWINEAAKIYRLLIDERKISTYHLTERVTKMWLFSWTAFLFTIYPALSAVAISGFDCEDYGPEGWRLRDHPEAFCPYKYAFGVVLRYENAERVVFQNISQIKANTSFRTSADEPEQLFMLSVTAVLSFALGIPVYMYLLLVINRVPQIAHRKRSHAAFQAFARYWRAKKVPGGIDHFAAYLIPEQESISRGKIVISVPSTIMPYIGQVDISKQMPSPNKLMREVERIVQTLAGGPDIDVVWNIVKQSSAKRASRLEIRLRRKNKNITDDLMNEGKISVPQILDRLNNKLSKQKADPELPGVWDYNKSGDQTFLNIVNHLFKRMAKTDAARQDTHRHATSKREEAQRAEMSPSGHSSANWTIFDEEMFFIREMYDAPCKAEFWEDGVVDHPNALPGLKWIDMGDEKPTDQVEIINEKLVTALQIKQHFTREDLINLNVSDLSYNSYIKVDEKCYKPAEVVVASNPYVTAVDIFEFVRKKQLGARQNLKHRLVPKNEDEEFEFVKSEMERQYDLKKSFVTLLRDLKHFDTDGGGDHNMIGSKWEEIGRTKLIGKEIQNDKLAAALQKRTVPSKEDLEKFDADITEDCFIRVGDKYFRPVNASMFDERTRKLRDLLQKGREDQMELDQEEFLKMCKDIQMSSTFILPTDDLGSLSTYKFNKLYEFVRGERIEHQVKFQITFQTPISIVRDKEKWQEDGLKIVKAMLKSKLKRAKGVKEQDKHRILKSLVLDHLDDEKEAEAEKEEAEEEELDAEDDADCAESGAGINVVGTGFGARDDTSEIQAEVPASQASGNTLDETIAPAGGNADADLAPQTEGRSRGPFFSKGKKDKKMLKWEISGKPESGTEIKNPKLAEALKVKVEFIEEELHEFPSGLRWEQMAETPPTKGKQLKNTKLSDALRSGRTTFAQHEWDSFGIVDLRKDDFIEVIASTTSSFFRPASFQLSDLPEDCYIQVSDKYYKPVKVKKGVVAGFVSAFGRLGRTQDKVESKDETLSFIVIFPYAIPDKKIKKHFISKVGMKRAIDSQLGNEASNVSCVAVHVSNIGRIAATAEDSDDDEAAENVREEYKKTQRGDSELANNVFTFTSLYKSLKKQMRKKSSDSKHQQSGDNALTGDKKVGEQQKINDKALQRSRTEEIIKHISDLEKKKVIKVETVAWDKFASEEEKRAINRAGFLFVNYEVQYWWYEIYETLKKLYFTCMVTLLQDGTAFQQMAAFLVNFAALVIHLLCRPWVNGKLDTMQAFSILVQTITIFYSIMLFIMQKSEDTSAGSKGGRMFVETLVIVVNCFVTVFPLLNMMSNFVTSLIQDAGIASTVRRIPIRSWVLLVWDASLLALAVIASAGLMPVSTTMGAYFQLAFQSFACFIGFLLCLNVIYVVFRILHRFYKTKAWTGGGKNTPHKSDLFWWELVEGVLHILPLVIFWYFLGEAQEGIAAARLACVMSAALAVVFMGLQIFMLDRKPVIGWKALQTKAEDEAFGVVMEEEEEDNELDAVPESDKIKANGVAAAEKSDAHRDGGSDEESDDAMSHSSSDSNDSDGGEVEAKVCSTCGVKSKAAARLLDLRQQEKSRKELFGQGIPGVLRVDGTKWQEIGTIRPQTGSEIHNEAFAAALQHTVEFTQEEWDKFKVSNLTQDSFVQVNGKYFKPLAFQNESAIGACLLIVTPCLCAVS